jgi:hypothetical protein
MNYAKHLAFIFTFIFSASHVSAGTIDFEVLELKATNSMVETFVKKLNDTNSTIRQTIEVLREQNRDGRNMSGGFPETFGKDDIQSFVLTRSENQRIRCGADANGDMVCDGRSLFLSFIVAIPEEICHNSGCDISTESVMYKVTSTMTESCQGSWDQDPWQDDICVQQYEVKDFLPVSIQ